MRVRITPEPPALHPDAKEGPKFPIVFPVNVPEKTYCVCGEETDGSLFCDTCFSYLSGEAKKQLHDAYRLTKDYSSDMYLAAEGRAIGEMHEKIKRHNRSAANESAYNPGADTGDPFQD